MERPLTSWKEIATHFNKSVRTVQRWEQQFGLPVRRPDLHDHGIVVAFPSELDSWMRTHLLVRNEPGNGHDADIRPEPAPLRQNGGAYFTHLENFHKHQRKSLELVHRTHQLLRSVQDNYALLKKTLDRNGELYKLFGDRRGRTRGALVPPDKPGRYSAGAD